MTHLVLVEDNELNRDMLIRRLVRRGYTVTWAGDGLEGVEAVKRERPAVVLMDLGLPVMDGWEATRALKANPETAGIPVIALTAHALSTDRDAAMAAGCDEYETKPVELDRLIEKIEALRAKAGA
jgi:two-component system cell cycle response regulator DivK